MVLVGLLLLGAGEASTVVIIALVILVVDTSVVPLGVEVLERMGAMVAVTRLHYAWVRFGVLVRPRPFFFFCEVLQRASSWSWVACAPDLHA